MSDIEISQRVSIPERMVAVYSLGAGGQNVNKVATGAL